MEVPPDLPVLAELPHLLQHPALLRLELLPLYEPIDHHLPLPALHPPLLLHRARLVLEQFGHDPFDVTDVEFLLRVGVGIQELGMGRDGGFEGGVFPVGVDELGVNFAVESSCPFEVVFVVHE